MDSVLLSIIISTYNRSEIVVQNLKKMLQFKRNDIEFIVCDNCSTDDTWEKLKEVHDNRLRIYHNEINYGHINWYLVSEKVRGKYFLNINDRDYFYVKGMKALCSRLDGMDEYDIIALSAGSRWKREKSCSYKQFLRCYFSSNHPGNLVYNTQFIHKNISCKVLRKNILEGSNVANSMYISYKMFLCTKKTYFFPCSLICQPENRDKIKQTRRELYGYAYILPEYHMQAYKNYIQYAVRHGYENHTRIREALTAVYRFGLLKVTVEYRRSVVLPGFCVRNHCEGKKPEEWFLNGIRYTMYVIRNRNTKKISGLALRIAEEYVWFVFSDTFRALKDAVFRAGGVRQ